MFGLKHTPSTEQQIRPEREYFIEEALATGNSPADVNANWIGYKTAGFADNAELEAWWLKVIQALEIEDELYDRGLNMKLDPKIKS